MPFPAMTPSSSTGCTKRPSTPSKRCCSIVSHQRSNGTFTTSPPSLPIAASFVSGAWSGTTIVHGTPTSRAAHASPWAMFPALAVRTPFASSSAEAFRTAL